MIEKEAAKWTFRKREKSCSARFRRSARRRYSSRNQTKRRYTRADFARGAVLPRIRAENLRRALPYTAAAQREIYGDFAGLVVGLLYFAQLHSGDRPDINGKESFLCQIQS